MDFEALPWNRVLKNQQMSGAGNQKEAGVFLSAIIKRPRRVRRGSTLSKIASFPAMSFASPPVATTTGFFVRNASAVICELAHLDATA